MNYLNQCHACKFEFDAAQANWCCCIVSERSLVCPKCLQCFCAAPPSYQNAFWTNAPKELLDLRQQQEDFTPWHNPDVQAVRRPLVLLVDDDSDILIAASRAIENLGYGVIRAMDGLDGLELARKYKPQVVLADALMPKLDGREMCRRIKEDVQMSSMKVIIMTSLYKQSRYRTEAYHQFHVDGYLTKPVDFELLRQTLEKYVK